VSLNTRILLYLSAAGASCGLYRRGILNEVCNLPSGEEGWEAFNDYLLRHPGQPIAIAVDTVDEVYRQEPLPRAHGADRREMTDRRLRQLVHQSPYRAALRQGAVAGPTAHERYLLMGLTNPEIIRPWLDIAHMRAAHLVGIWLLPALAIPLARQFHLDTGRLLLVSEQTGGLRLTYLDGGELRFSRLAPVDGSPYKNPLQSYAEEIERTRLSLVGQRLLARAEPLRTLLIDPLHTLQELHGLLPAAAGFRCETVTRAALIDTLDLPPSLLAESSDALYLRLLANAPRGANLMTSEQHAITRAHWLRRGIRFVAATWFGASVMLSAILLIDSVRLEHQVGQHRQTENRFRAEEAQLLDRAGGVDAVKKRLKRAHAWEMITTLDASPSPMFGAAFEVIQAHDALQAHQLKWTFLATHGKPHLTLEGEITPFDGDFQRAHQYVQAFAGDLQKRLGASHAVRVAAWPLNSSSETSQEGEFGHGSPNARFSLEVDGRP